MEHFQIQFFSTKFKGIIGISYKEEQGEVIIDFLNMFNAEYDIFHQKIRIDYKHRNTKEFQKKLERFVLKYKDISPHIQHLRAKLKRLEDNEWFFILPPMELNTKQKYELEKELNQLNNYKNNVNEELLSKLFGCILDNYEIITFDLDTDKKIKIGIGKKNKRICRFCKQKTPNASFKKEAHAISEALGNKKLILNEECDVCNEFFDQYVERDFIYFHDPARVFFGIKNKDNKIPKMKGKNFKFLKNDANNLSITIVDDAQDGDKDKPPKKVVLKTGNKIKLQNIYKALCKFALSVIDSKYIDDFETTIKWLKNQKKVDKLPKIAVWNSYKFFTNRPEITLYLRNNENYNLPYLVGEFRFTYYMYIFIVPFSAKDNRKFLSDEEYREFLNCFKQITATGEFNYIDFSQNIERELVFNFQFEKRKD